MKNDSAATTKVAAKVEKKMTATGRTSSGTAAGAASATDAESPAAAPYSCNVCSAPLPLRLPRPGEVASSWECRHCGSRFYATLIDNCQPDVLTNVRPADDVHPRIAIGGQVLAELHKRDGRPGRGFEERQFPRVEHHLSLSVSIEGLPMAAQTMDLSAGGLSFITHQKAEPGDVFSVRFESIPGRPIAQCVVRNCTEMRPGVFRIGAEFLCSGRP